MAQQNARAIELEKEDILNNYRDACQQIDRLQENISKSQEENKDLYQQLQQVNSQAGGASYQLVEMQKKEENYVQEIMTLERHIDSVTHQLQQAQQNQNNLTSERDRLQDECNTMRQITNNQETDRTDLQRTIAGFQNEKQAFDRKAVDFESEISNLKSQLNYEASRYKEMESIVQNERRSAHNADGTIQSLRRQNEDLVTQADRL